MKFRAVSIVGSALIAAVGLLIAPAHASADDAIPKAGDCIIVSEDSTWDAYGPVTIVPCTDKHNGEVYKVLDYPADLGKPSEVAGRVWELFWSDCPYSGFTAWLGAGKVEIPVSAQRQLRLPTDEQWEGGARWIVCRGMRLGANGQVMTMTGTLPQAFAAGPIFSWLICAKGKPVSGKWTSSPACTAKSQWLNLGGVEVKGKASSAYPGPLQKVADANCSRLAKPYLIKGRAAPIAALPPKADFEQGSNYAECFILVKDWNKKTG